MSERVVQVERVSSGDAALYVVEGQYGVYLKGLVIPQRHILTITIADFTAELKATSYKMLIPAADKRRDIASELAEALRRGEDLSRHDIILFPEGWANPCKVIDVDINDYMVRTRDNWRLLCSDQYCILCGDSDARVEVWEWNIDLSSIPRLPEHGEAWRIPVNLPREYKKLIAAGVVWKRDVMYKLIARRIEVVYNRDEDALTIRSSRCVDP